MKDLFRSFDRDRVRYLLIGGQAAILYGAAHFTQDLDLWLAPTEENLRGFLRSLARLGARVHRLTPPVTLRNARRGHGFHFLVPQHGQLPIYLDAMARPPRVGSFAQAMTRREVHPTPWGRLSVVGIPDLVELKKTNRPGDYEVVSTLARMRVEPNPRPRSALLAWALTNTFRTNDLAWLIQAHGERFPSRVRDVPELRRLLSVPGCSGPRWETALMDAGSVLDRRMATCIRLGREYWLPRIAELRALRRAGRLVPEGTPVRNLLGAHD